MDEKNRVYDEQVGSMRIVLSRNGKIRCECCGQMRPFHSPDTESKIDSFLASLKSDLLKANADGWVVVGRSCKPD